MSEEPEVDAGGVRHYKKKTRKKAPGDSFEFTLPGDEHVFVANRPKTAVLFSMGQQDDTSESYFIYAKAFLDMPDMTYLTERLLDTEHDWDFDDLEDVVKDAKAKWWARPTGRRTGSAAPPQKTGRASTVRSPSARKTP